jgi:hypothetical protein
MTKLTFRLCGLNWREVVMSLRRDLTLGLSEVTNCLLIEKSPVRIKLNNMSSVQSSWTAHYHMRAGSSISICLTRCKCNELNQHARCFSFQQEQTEVLKSGVGPYSPHLISALSTVSGGVHLLHVQSISNTKTTTGRKFYCWGIYI